MDDYFKERDKKNLAKLQELRAKLPPYVNGYFVSIGPRTSALTKVGYARDLLCFFDFLVTLQRYPATCAKEIRINDLESMCIPTMGTYTATVCKPNHANCRQCVLYLSICTTKIC